MGEQIIDTSSEAVKRWRQKMPKFFHMLMMLAVGVGTTASAIHFGLPQLGIEHSEWWADVYRWVMGTSIGVAFASKFTCDGGFRKQQAGKLTGYGAEQQMEE